MLNLVTSPAVASEPIVSAMEEGEYNAAGELFSTLVEDLKKNLALESGEKQVSTLDFDPIADPTAELIEINPSNAAIIAELAMQISELTKAPIELANTPQLTEGLSDLAEVPSGLVANTNDMLQSAPTDSQSVISQEFSTLVGNNNQQAENLDSNNFSFGQINNLENNQVAIVAETVTLPMQQTTEALDNAIAAEEVKLEEAEVITPTQNPQSGLLGGDMLGKKENAEADVKIDNEEQSSTQIEKDSAHSQSLVQQTTNKTASNNSVKSTQFASVLENLKENSYLSPTEQIKTHISTLKQSGEQTISVNLQPKELGKIEIKLDINNNNLHNIRIKVENAGTFDLLQKDIATLEKALADIGVKTESSQLSFNLNQQQNQNQWQKYIAPDWQHKNKLAEEVIIQEPSKYLSSTARLDIEV
jgi:flagellar hook-length control protein FliK